MPEYGLDLSAVETIIAGLVLLLAAYVRGLTGFAFSAVLVAGLSFIIDPLDAVPVALAFEVAASTIQGRTIWSEIEWRPLGVLLAAALVGNPMGVMILTTIDPDVLRAATLGVLALVSLGLLIRHRGAVAPTLPVFFLVGVVAGVVNGATALSGLVLVLAMSFMTIPPIAMRSTLIAYFFVSNLAVVGLLGLRGDIGHTTLWRLVVGLPLLTVGIFMGSSTFRRTPPETFRRITLVLLVSVSTAGLLRVVLG